MVWLFQRMVALGWLDFSYGGSGLLVWLLKKNQAKASWLCLTQPEKSHSAFPLHSTCNGYITKVSPNQRGRGINFQSLWKECNKIADLFLYNCTKLEGKEANNLRETYHKVCLCSEHKDWGLQTFNIYNLSVMYRGRKIYANQRK